MQNRYAGDIGDFGKFGLLRTLAQTDPSLRLGLIWYLYPQEDGRTNDGKFIDYLKADVSPANRRLFEDCDPQLYEKLKVFLDPHRRAVSEFPKLELFERPTVYFEEPLQFTGGPRDRATARDAWFERALAATTDCDVVLLDPDNGVRDGIDKGDLRSGKFVYSNEIADLLSAGKTVIVYQHLNRRGTAEVQLSNRANRLRTDLRLAHQPILLRHRRGSGRAYIIIPQERHVGIIKEVIQTLTKSPWSKQFETAELVSTVIFEHPPSRIVLTGFSGTGKSAVGPLLATHFGWTLVDTDAIVEKRAGKRILEIFRDDGEDAFRDLEAEAILEASADDKLVLSTGGGAVLRAENRRALAEGGFVVCLEARPETIFERLTARGDAEPLDRPLLATADPLARIKELKNARQHLYALCDWAVHSDGLSPEEVAAEIVRAYEERAAAIFAAPGRVAAMSDPDAEVPSGTLHAIPSGAACMVRTSSREYPVFTGWGNLGELGRRLREAGLTGFAYVISDETVWHHLGDEVEKSLRSAEIDFDVFTVPPGEASKSLGNASDIYDWLIEHRAERGHAVVAVGGGVATDLGGYVAATFARGLPLILVPTSLLGMVDAAIGGKVAVNHPRAKNMIGVFHQPRLVLEDVATLRTLPEREIKSGLAEAIKHGLIADPAYLDFLEQNAAAILKLDRQATVEAVRRSVCIKAEVVGADEFETTGRRSTLNYGHTLAHAIESTTGYARFRHGEADGIGMTAAAAISVRMGLLAPEVKDRQRRILELFGLPTHADGLDRARLLAAIALDKKVVGKKVRWVLLEDVGRTVIRDDVPPEVVEAALDEVLH